MAEKKLTIAEIVRLTGAKRSTVLRRCKNIDGAEKISSPIGDYWLIPESAAAEFKNVKIGRPRKDS